MDLRSLWDRLQSATGPSLRLDRDIAYVLRLVPDDEIWNGNTFYRAVERYPDDPVGVINCWRIRPYTASLDASVEVVERVLPDWSWSVRRMYAGGSVYDENHTGEAVVELFDDDQKRVTKFYRWCAATPALALLSALVAALIKESSHAQ